MNKLLILTAMICLAAAAAQGQTKITGTVTCPPKPAQELAVPVGDKPGHVMSLTQDKCTWSKPFQLNGSPVKESTQVSSNEATGNSAKGYGFDIGITASSDKYFVRYEGTSTMQNGVMVSGSGTWSFIGGTGKLSNLKGKGTYSCKGSATSSSCDIAGDYQVAP